jgi:hypothetical protein
VEVPVEMTLARLAEPPSGERSRKRR